MNGEPKRLQLGKGVVIEPDVVIGDDVTIGHYVVIKRGTVIGNGVRIGDHVVLGKLPSKNNKMAVKPQDRLARLRSPTM